MFIYSFKIFDLYAKRVNRVDVFNMINKHVCVEDLDTDN